MFGLIDSSFLEKLWLGLVMCWGTSMAFWLITMQRSLDLVFPNNKMKGQNVWLTFIPFFGLVWQFIVVNAVADSLGEEYKRRGIISREPRPGYQSGLTANILLCCAFIPSFGILIAYFSTIPRIIHLVKIKNYIIDLENIIQTQMQYEAQASQLPINYQEEKNISLEESLRKNNPNRFLPPMTKEEVKNRWRKNKNG